MNEADAIHALSALANPHRLSLFRALVRAGPAGMTAGQLAAAAELTASSLTFHAQELERAGLIETRREGRFMRSALNVPAMRGLIAFLSEDCCGGRPELCGAAGPARTARDIADCCPAPTQTKTANG